MLSTLEPFSWDSPLTYYTISVGLYSVSALDTHLMLLQKLSGIFAGYSSPNALLRVLSLQGLYIKIKLFSLFGLLIQQPHAISNDLPADLDCFSSVLFVLTL